MTYYFISNTHTPDFKVYNGQTFVERSKPCKLYPTKAFASKVVDELPLTGLVVVKITLPKQPTLTYILEPSDDNTKKLLLLSEIAGVQENLFQKMILRSSYDLAYNEYLKLTNVCQKFVHDIVELLDLLNAESYPELLLLAKEHFSLAEDYKHTNDETVICALYHSGLQYLSIYLKTV